MTARERDSSACPSIPEPVPSLCAHCTCPKPPASYLQRLTSRGHLPWTPWMPCRGIPHPAQLCPGPPSPLQRGREGMQNYLLTWAHAQTTHRDERRPRLPSKLIVQQKRGVFLQCRSTLWLSRDPEAGRPGAGWWLQCAFPSTEGRIAPRMMVALLLRSFPPNPNSPMKVMPFSTPQEIGLLSGEAESSKTRRTQGRGTRGRKAGGEARGRLRTTP